MDCNKIKELIPRYFNHTADEDEIKQVEEHLCICHDCRTLLGELMDEISDLKADSSKDSKDDQMQIISRDDIGRIPMPEAEPQPDLDGAPSSLEPSSKIEPEKNMEYFPAKDLDPAKEKKKEQEAKEAVDAYLEKSSQKNDEPSQEPEKDIPQINQDDSPLEYVRDNDDHSKEKKDSIDLDKTSQGSPGSDAADADLLASTREESLDKNKDEPVAGQKEEARGKPENPNLDAADADLLASTREESLDKNKDEPVAGQEEEGQKKPKDPKQEDKKDMKNSPYMTFDSDSDSLAKEPDSGSDIPITTDESPEVFDSAKDSSSSEQNKDTQEPQDLVQEIKGIEEESRTSQISPKLNLEDDYSLDKQPIEPSKTDMTSYIILGVAVLTLVACIYFFLQIKG